MTNKADIIQELITVGDWIRWAVSRFEEANIYYGHGCDNPWDEAVQLVLLGLHIPIDTDQRVIHGRLTIDERCKVLDLIMRRVTERVPVPYLCNKAYFCGLPFYVNEDVIIPRSPIAEWVEMQFNPWVKAADVHQVLDMCTGGGCIAIALAHAFLSASVDAVDISQSALDVAKINVDDYHLAHRLNLIKSDLFNDVPQKAYDLIICNPPYVDAPDIAALPQEHLHEPMLALEAGDDGLDLIIRVLAVVSNYLSEDGVLVAEVGNSERHLLEQFPQVPFTWLEFERGGHGVFLLRRSEILEHEATFEAARVARAKG